MDMKHKVLSGSELFEFDGVPLQESVKDFWAWAMSRLIADGPRGDLAEYIVNTALGMDMTIPKKGWGECDIVYNVSVLRLNALPIFRHGNETSHPSQFSRWQRRWPAT